MSASKSCPACLKQWAGTFKFCPEDGALLVALHSAETVLQTEAISAEVAAAHATQVRKQFNASDTVVVPAVVPYQTETSLPAASPSAGSTRATLASDTVVVAAVKPSEAARGQGSSPIDTDEYASAAPPKDESWRSPVAAPPVERSPTSPKARKGAPRILNLEPVEPEPEPQVAPSNGSASLGIEVQDPALRRELGLRMAPTVMTPSAAEHVASESRALASQPFQPEAGSILVDGVAVEPDAGSGPRVVGRGIKRVDVSTEPGRPESKREQAKAEAAPAPASGRAPAEAPKKGQQPDTKSTRQNEARGRTPAQTSPHGKGAAKQAAQQAAQAQKAQEPAKLTKAPQGGPTTQQPVVQRTSLTKGGAPPTTGSGLRKRSAFSDTDWFMRPDLPVDTETGRVQVDPQAYVRDESIPEEQRRRFSLRRKDEE